MHMGYDVMGQDAYPTNKMWRERETDRQTDRPTDGRTDRQTGRQAGRQSVPFPTAPSGTGAASECGGDPGC